MSKSSSSVVSLALLSVVLMAAGAYATTTNCFQVGSTLFVVDASGSEVCYHYVGTDDCDCDCG